MKIKLLDRIILINLLPQEGKFESLIIREELIEKLQLTQDELEKYKIKTNEDNHLIWEDTKDEFEYEFTTLETNAIKDQLKKLNKEEKLTAGHMNIYKLFIK